VGFGFATEAVRVTFGVSFGLAFGAESAAEVAGASALPNPKSRAKTLPDFG
jgi:hypothetical protein